MESDHIFYCRPKLIIFQRNFLFILLIMFLGWWITQKTFNGHAVMLVATFISMLVCKSWWFNWVCKNLLVSFVFKLKIDQKGLMGWLGFVNCHELKKDIAKGLALNWVRV